MHCIGPVKINANKTKTMLVSKGVAMTKVSLEIDGDIIKQTDNYTYLGQTITSNGKCDDAILKRIEIARGAFNSMLKTVSARHISMKTRKIIIKAYVWSTLLYGCETWLITTVVLLTLLMSGDSMKHKGSDYVRILYSLTIQVMLLQSTCYGVHIL